jgi:hypothetical protein
LVALCERVDLLPGVGQEVFIDIDSLLRPVYGHAKQGASHGHTKIAGKQILRKGLSALATTISTPGSAPVIAGPWLRAGRANSGRVSGASSPKQSAPPAPSEPAARFWSVAIRRTATARWWPRVSDMARNFRW